MNLAALIELTDGFSDELVPVSGDAPDVCPVCHTGKPEAADMCNSCELTTSQVDLPCRTIIPISYYTTPSPLRERMHDYKEHHDPTVRHEQSIAVAAIIARYLHEHGAALAERFGTYDEIVAVPSTKHPPSSPLATALRTHFPTLIAPVTEHLTVGPGAMSFRQASPTGFIANDAVTSRSILLIDDTFTTGARMQSAAHALQHRGANLIAALVVCRKINPDPRYHTDAIWQRQTAVPFSYTTTPSW